MQYHKLTKKYTKQCNKKQCNTIQHYMIAYDAFQTKTEHLWTKKGTFWAIKVRKQPTKQLKAHILENQRHTELPGDMGKIWSHWSGSVWAQKSGLYGHSVEKIAFLAQKGPFWAIGARKRPAERPNGHLQENRRYPELPEDMGKI